jgi:hypothetical protein
VTAGDGDRGSELVGRSRVTIVVELDGILIHRYPSVYLFFMRSLVSFLFRAEIAVAVG